MGIGRKILLKSRICKCVQCGRFILLKSRKNLLENIRHKNPLSFCGELSLHQQNPILLFSTHSQEVQQPELLQRYWAKENLLELILNENRSEEHTSELQSQSN